MARLAPLDPPLAIMPLFETWSDAGPLTYIKCAGRPTDDVRPHFTNSTSLLFLSTVGCVRFVIHWVVMSLFFQLVACTRLLASRDSRLLQCRADRFTAATTLAPTYVAASSACRRSTGERPTTTWPRYVGKGAPLNWLPIAQRIEYKLCLLVYKSIVGQAPVYMKNLLTAVAYMFHIAVNASRSKLWRGTLSYRGLASSSQRGDGVFRRSSTSSSTSVESSSNYRPQNVAFFSSLLHSSALWKLFCSGRHYTICLISRPIGYRFYSQTVPVLSFFSVLDIVMRRRSICR